MLKEIYERQSIRKYSKQEVEEEKLLEVLRAGMNAPTARNAQSWRFMVVHNRKALQDMVDLQPYMAFMKDAPCAILVMGDIQTTTDQGYLYLDGAAAIQNMLIEAVHQGLSTCWCGIAPLQDRIKLFQEYYKLEENLVPIALVAIGYGDETKEKVDRFDPQKISYFK
ncbi:nitroreductase family protein [Amedibacillus sp. YH-ame10]